VAIKKDWKFQKFYSLGVALGVGELDDIAF